MKNNKKKIKIAAAIISITLIALSFTSIYGGQRTYKVRPEIELPLYRTDGIRMIEAYERLMERYMDMVEKNLGTIDLDIKSTAQTLDSIDKKLDELSARTARIEKALGIEKPQGPINKSNNMQESKQQDVLAEGQLQ